MEQELLLRIRAASNQARDAVKATIQNLEGIAKAGKAAGQAVTREMQKAEAATEQAAEATEALKERLDDVKTAASGGSTAFLAQVQQRARAAVRELEELRSRMLKLSQGGGARRDEFGRFLPRGSRSGGLQLGNVTEGLENAFRTLGGVAKGALGGIFTGVQLVAGGVVDLTARITGGLLNAFRSVLGIGTHFVAVVGGGVTALAAAFIGLGLKSNTFKEGQLAALEAMTKSKDAARDLFNFFSRFADVTPFDDQEVVEAGKAMETFGLDARRNLRLVGDTAFAMKKPLEQVVAVLAKMKAGSFDMIEAGAIGITREDLTKHGVKFEKDGSAKNPERLLGASLDFLQSKFGGSMGNAAEGMDAGLSTAFSNIRRMAARAVEGLFESIKRGLGKFNALMSQVLDGDAGRRIIQALAVPFDLLGRVLENVADKLPAFTQWLSQIATKENVVGVLAKIGGWIGVLKNKVAEFFVTLAGNGGAGGAWKSFQEVAYNAIDGVVRLWNGFLAVLGHFVQNKDELFGALRDAFKSLADPVRDFFMDVQVGLHVAVGAALTLGDTLKNIVDTLKGIPTEIRGAFQALSGLGQGSGAGAGMRRAGGLRQNLHASFYGWVDHATSVPESVGAGIGAGATASGGIMANGRSDRNTGASPDGRPRVFRNGRWEEHPAYVNPGATGDFARRGRAFFEGTDQGSASAGAGIGKGIQKPQSPWDRIGNWFKSQDAAWNKGRSRGIKALEEEQRRLEEEHRKAFMGMLRGSGGSGSANPNLPETTIIGGRVGAPPAAAGPAGPTDEQFKELVEQRNAYYEALREEANLAIQAAPEAKRGAMEVARIIPLLNAQVRDVLIPQMERARKGSKEHYELLKNYHQIQGNINEINRRAAKEQLDHAKKAAGDAKQLAEARIGLLEAQLKNDPTLTDKQRGEKLIPSLVEQFRRLSRSAPGETELEGVQRQTAAEGIKSRLMEILGVSGKGIRVLGGTLQGYGKEALGRLNDLLGVGPDGQPATQAPNLADLARTNAERGRLRSILRQNNGFMGPEALGQLQQQLQLPAAALAPAAARGGGGGITVNVPVSYTHDFRDPAFRQRLHAEIDRKLDDEERRMWHSVEP